MCRFLILVLAVLLAAMAGFIVDCSDSGSSGRGDDDTGDDDSSPSLPVCKDLGGSGVSVASVSPGDGEERVLRMPVITVTFDGSVDSATFTAAHVKLWQGSTTVPLVFEATTGGHTSQTTKPAQELAYLTEYKLTFDGLADENGVAVPACQVSFTTKSKTVKIATGVGVSMSIDEDGTLWTWGGMPGLPPEHNQATRDIPEIFDLGAKVVAIAASYGFSVAATEDGLVWAWGDNSKGQLGRGTSGGSGDKAKVQMTLPSGVTVTQLALGEKHALALRSDGIVMAWGHNEAGELGDGTTVDKSTPIEVPDITDVVAIGAGMGHTGGGTVDGAWSMILKNEGTVWGFGSNCDGQIIVDDPYTPYFTVPQQIPVSNITAISATGVFNGYAVADDKSAWSWGSKYFGALGNGTCGLSEPEPPVQVSGPGGSGKLGNVAQVAGGSSFALAMLTDGTVWGWGNNSSAALGDGTTGQTVDCGEGSGLNTNTRPTPVQALNITTAIAIAATNDQGLILFADGSVWAAGYNTNDKLGVGDDVVCLPDTADVGIYAEVPGL